MTELGALERKRVLTIARGGAYAHAGEEEAIDLVFAGIPPDGERRILDAGCGLGGTSAYIVRHGWGQVTGIDLDGPCVEHARAHWPEVAFEQADILDVGREGPRFDLACLFNVFYSVSPQADALRGLREAVVDDGRLLLFDYTDRGGYGARPIVIGGRNVLPRPICLPDDLDMFTRAGWRIDACTDLTDRFLAWYVSLCDRIRARRAEIVAFAGEDAYAYACAVYDAHVDAVRDGRLGGVLLCATAVAWG